MSVKTLAVMIQPTHTICKQASVSMFQSNSVYRNRGLTGPGLAHRPLFADHGSKKCKFTHSDIKQITGHNNEAGIIKEHEETFGG